MSLSQKLSASTPWVPLSSPHGSAGHLERGDCEKGLAELLSRLESISANMVGSDNAEQLRRDGESLRKDLDAQLSAELTLVQRIESLERTIHWLSDKKANERAEQEVVNSEGEMGPEVKPRLQGQDDAFIESNIECKETRPEEGSSLGLDDGAVLPWLGPLPQPQLRR